MAPLPPESTARYFVDYTTVGLQHTAEVRANAPLAPGAFGAAWNSFMLAIEPLLFLQTIDQVRFAVSGSNVSAPVITGLEGTTYGAGAGTVDSAPVALNFVGRSSGGRRVRLMIFCYLGAFSTYRLHSAESTEIASGVSELNSGANFALAIDGIKPVWYPYANVLVNAYWQRNVRA